MPRAELRPQSASTASRPRAETLYARIRERRPLLTALFVLAALAAALLDRDPAADLLHPRAAPGFVLPWLAMVVGAAVRIWGAGNLHKDREITDTGIYRLARHPLYLGSLLIFFAYFISVGDRLVGVVLFLGLLGLVYYPTMLAEEASLEQRYPAQAAAYRGRPRLLPDLSRLPEAIATDRFSLGAAWRNLGVRSVWMLLLLPLLLEALRTFEGALH